MCQRVQGLGFRLTAALAWDAQTRALGDAGTKVAGGLGFRVPCGIGAYGCDGTLNPKLCALRTVTLCVVVAAVPVMMEGVAVAAAPEPAGVDHWVEVRLFWQTLRPRLANPWWLWH